MEFSSAIVGAHTHSGFGIKDDISYEGESTIDGLCAIGPAGDYGAERCRDKVLRDWMEHYDCTTG